MGESGPAATSLPILPLIAAISAIVLVTAAWLTTEAWMAASQSDAVARALTGGDPAHASVLVTRYGCADATRSRACLRPTARSGRRSATSVSAYSSPACCPTPRIT